ncbi:MULTISPECIES: hypothetical protein [unclassified Dysgonomonas]|uniref:hypothetical protein n=1 Tax=unclassified Dysgonomonas TaxID=2630389 RepID=UPI0013EA1C6C|nr:MULTISPECIES: hypothetical protein [unclassified Dysgonomonas]
MLNSGIRRYISNSVIGLLPFVLYLILHSLSRIQEQYALMASLAIAIIAEILIRGLSKSRMFSITFYVSTLALAFTLIFWLFAHNYLQVPNTYSSFCEICIVSMLIGIRLSKTFIATKFFRKRSLLQKAFLNEFYHIASLLQYTLTMHIFFVLMYEHFKMTIYDDRISDIVVYSVLPIVGILAIGIYQIARTGNIVAKLKQEEWLPIVTEKGEVTGKIAKSVSLKMKNKFLHPIVRVALISNGKVFLQERANADTLSPRKLDYPFEKYMLFNHEINLAARNSIKKMMGDEMDLPLKFLLKYVFENEETKRLTFLFIIKIEDEYSIKRTEQMNGKFWSVKQIEAAFADEIFSEPFELEFEYLKNMVLAPIDHL